MEYMWLLLALVGKLEAGPRADKRDGFFTLIGLELKVWEKRPNITLSLSLQTMTECKMLVCAYGENDLGVCVADILFVSDELE